MEKTVLLTGARGFLGRNLLQALGHTDSHTRFLVLARSEEAQKDLLRWFGSYGPERFRVMRGDILHAGLGLTADDTAALTGVSQLWHIAASTSFDEREKEAIYQGNVLGTQNVLALAKSLRHLENFHYISTAYVAGLNTGPVAEDEMPPLNGFRNSYEASKWEAEKVVRQSQLPFTIYRPSIIMGHSQSLDSQCERRMIYGYVLGIFYAVLKECKRRQIDFLQRWRSGDVLELDLRLLGHNAITKNFVCIDDVANSIPAILQADHVGKTFHLTSASPILGATVAESIERALRIKGVCQGGDEIIDPNPLERCVMNFTSPFVPYTTRSDPVFRLDNTNAALGAAHARTPMDNALFSHLVEHFVQNEVRLRENKGIEPLDEPMTAVA